MAPRPAAPAPLDLMDLVVLATRSTKPQLPWQVATKERFNLDMRRKKYHTNARLLPESSFLFSEVILTAPSGIFCGESKQKCARSQAVKYDSSSF
jgi:hypothetical protein